MELQFHPDPARKLQEGVQKKILVLLYKRRMREQKAFPGVLFHLSAPECPQFVLCGEVLKNGSLNVRNQRRNSTAHASLASKPQEFFERTLLTYDQWRTQNFFWGGGSTNSVEDREKGDLGG